MRNDRCTGFLLTVLALVLVAVASVWAWHRDTRSYIFDDVSGPAGITKLDAARPARVDDFDRGSIHRLAILVTDPSSNWLGLLRGFKARGVPVRITLDPAEAFKHNVVLVYPIVSGKALTREALQAIAQHVRDGGSVLAFELAGGGLEDVFGVSGYVPNRARQIVRWTKGTGIPEEDEISVNKEEKLWTLGYHTTDADVLARFDDQSAAVACHTSAGSACVMGLDLGHLAQLGMDDRAEPINRHYVNAYEPSVDVLFQWVQDFYVEHEPMPWLVSTVPDDREVSILLTHDIDYTGSVGNALTFSRALAEAGVSGTFFIQTKYRRDFDDKAFFDQSIVPVLIGLRQSGMEIASHSVSHSVVFNGFPTGTGTERYPAYSPTVEARNKAVGGTILGELRVSKFLLETIGKTTVRSFRPGNLSNPFALPESMQAVGIRYSSSLTADAALTHFPFQNTYSRRGRALVRVFEFPITIEDERRPALIDRFGAAQAVISKIATHRGLVVLLNHPNETGGKLEFERRLIDAWKGRAWFGRVDEFGDWWAARNDVEIDVDGTAGNWHLTASARDAVYGLAIHFPKAKQTSIRIDIAGGSTIRRDLP